VIAKKTFALLATALVWGILFVAIRMFTSLGDCLENIGCWARKERAEAIATVVLVGSYLVIAWFVIRTRKL
jgi:hypothetical protein